MPAIDLHAHWHAPEFVALIEKEGAANGGKVSRNARGQVVLSVPGMTTVFHGVTWSWEPGLRDSENARAILAAIERLKGKLAADE